MRRCDFGLETHRWPSTGQRQLSCAFNEVKRFMCQGFLYRMPVMSLPDSSSRPEGSSPRQVLKTVHMLSTWRGHLFLRTKRESVVTAPPPPAVLCRRATKRRSSTPFPRNPSEAYVGLSRLSRHRRHPPYDVTQRARILKGLIPRYMHQTETRLFDTIINR